VGDRFNRRSLVQSLVGTAAGVGALRVAASAAVSAAPQHDLDLQNPADLSYVFRKLAYSADGELGFWYLTSTRHGLVDAELIPFWQMNIGRFFAVKDLPGGGYVVTQMGIAFYTDLKTGELLRTFRNPLTGRSVKLPYGKPSPAEFAAPSPRRADYELTEAMGSQAPNAQMHVTGALPTGTLGPAWLDGDHVWIQQDHLLKATGAAAGGPRSRVNDLTTYFGSWRDIRDPKITMPPAGHAFTDINNWPEFLEMGDQPGVYYSRGMGFKASSFGEMPDIWRRLMRQEFPEIASDPRKALLG
jgi:hypothetical protein